MEAACVYYRGMLLHAAAVCASHGGMLLVVCYEPFAGWVWWDEVDCEYMLCVLIWLPLGGCCVTHTCFSCSWVIIMRRL
jgi:hypothetical protein